MPGDHPNLRGTSAVSAAFAITMATLDFGAPISRLRRRFEHAPWQAVGETIARLGYAARAAVYLSIGLMALLAALDLTPRAEGALGALEAWGKWPAGVVLLWLLGVGLYGFAGWRAVQAVFDVDRCGRNAKGVLSRLGQAISGVTYAGLAISVFGLLDALEDLHETDDRADTRAAVEQALAMPFGNLLVIAAGLFVLGAGVGSVVRAGFDHFGRQLDCDRPVRAWAGTLARVGYAARGVALIPAGGLLAMAGFNARASEARGLGGALDILAAQPFGEGMLALLALGLMAFGVFALAEGALRPINLQRVAALAST